MAMKLVKKTAEYSIYLRGDKHLYCFEGSAGAPAPAPVPVDAGTPSP